MYLKFQMNEVCVLGEKKEAQTKKDKKGLGAGAIFGIVLLLVLIIAIAAGCVYAYRHPTSKPGLWLIEVRFFSVTLVIYPHCTPLPPHLWEESATTVIAKA